MSLSLVKRGLDLFEDDLQPAKDAKKKKKKTPATSAMAQIRPHKKGVKKQLTHLKRQEELRQAANKKLKSQKPVYVEEKDHTLDNVMFLKKLDTLQSAKPAAVSKIVEHGRGKLCKNQPKEKEIEPEANFFSDRDFEKFEESYQLEQDFWKK